MSDLELNGKILDFYHYLYQRKEPFFTNETEIRLKFIELFADYIDCQLVNPPQIH